MKPAIIMSTIFFASGSGTVSAADIGVASKTGKKLTAQTAPCRSGWPSGVRGRPGSAVSEVGT